MNSLSTRMNDWPPLAANAEPHSAWGLRVLSKLSLPLCLLMFGGCEAARFWTTGSPAAISMKAGMASSKQEELRMWMAVGEHRFTLTMTDNSAAREFIARLPLTLDMAELNGNEKHADLTKALPENVSRPGTICNGDLMLYGTRTVVVFYSTFHSPYSYTRLGHVDDPSGLAQALGRGNARVAFSKNQ